MMLYFQSSNFEWKEKQNFWVRRKSRIEPGGYLAAAFWIEMGSLKWSALILKFVCVCVCVCVCVHICVSVFMYLYQMLFFLNHLSALFTRIYSKGKIGILKL